MKKLSFLLLSLMAMTLLTACNGGNEPSTVQKLTSTINCRAIEGDVVVFSQGTANVEVDYTNMVIKFTSPYVDMNGHSSTLSTPEMKLKNVSPTTYEFTASASQQVGSGNIESLGGYIDFATGMLWYTINTASCEIVCSSQILYAYATTEISNPDNDNYGVHQKSAYLFALDSKGESCTLQISNFMSNVNGTVDAPVVEYVNLTLLPIVTGYEITADEVESNYKGYYKLTDVDFTLDEQCQTINGSFKCNGLEYEVKGPLFQTKTSN